MARNARIVLDRHCTLIEHRSINKYKCLRSPLDTDYMRLLIQEQTAYSGCEVHALCLLPNRFLIMTTPRQAAQLAPCVSKIAQRYAQYCNRTYGRIGPLWAGRFRSCILQAGLYREICRLYLHSLSTSETLPALRPSITDSAFPSDTCPSFYNEYVPRLERALASNGVFGTRLFREEIHGLVGRPLPGRVGRPVKPINFRSGDGSPDRHCP